MRKKDKWLLALMPVILFLITMEFTVDSVWKNQIPGSYEWYDLCKWEILSEYGFPMLIAAVGIMLLRAEPAPSGHRILSYYLPLSVVMCGFFWVSVSLITLQQQGVQDVDQYLLLEAMADTLKEPYNMSFYYLLIILFAFWPVIKPVADTHRLTGYAALISFSLGIANNLLAIIPAAGKLYLFTSQLNWGDFTEFGFYLFFGLWLADYEVPGYLLFLVGAAGIVSGVASFVLTVNSVRDGSFSDNYLGAASIFTAISASALLMICKYLLKRFPRKAFLYPIDKCGKYFLLVPGLIVWMDRLSGQIISLEQDDSIIRLTGKAVLTWLSGIGIGILISRFFRQITGMILKKRDYILEGRLTDEKYYT